MGYIAQICIYECTWRSIRYRDMKHQSISISISARVSGIMAIANNYSYSTRIHITIANHDHVKHIKWNQTSGCTLRIQQLTCCVNYHARTLCCFSSQFCFRRWASVWPFGCACTDNVLVSLMHMYICIYIFISTSFPFQSTFDAPQTCATRVHAFILQLLNILLTIIGWLPGVIHAWFVVIEHRAGGPKPRLEMGIAHANNSPRAGA